MLYLLIGEIHLQHIATGQRLPCEYKGHRTEYQNSERSQKSAEKDIAGPRSVASACGEILSSSLSTESTCVSREYYRWVRLSRGEDCYEANGPCLYESFSLLEEWEKGATRRLPKLP